MLKESGRERINAVYGTKEQCRKDFQDEIARLRNQFQLVSKEKTLRFSFNHPQSVFPPSVRFFEGSINFFSRDVVIDMCATSAFHSQCRRARKEISVGQIEVREVK